jgi:hypothetical protein
VEACQADGVHVGQDDATPAQARAAVGPERIVGRSTHEPAQALTAQADPDVDYLAVGPVHATPTKPGRRATGLAYVEMASKTLSKPWFAIGGIDTRTVRCRPRRTESSSCVRSPRPRTWRGRARPAGGAAWLTAATAPRGRAAQRSPPASVLWASSSPRAGHRRGRQRGRAAGGPATRRPRRPRSPRDAGAAIVMGRSYLVVLAFEALLASPSSTPRCRSCSRRTCSAY